MTVFPAPNLIGAPQRYSKWRTMQDVAMLAAAESLKRHVMQIAPTAFGKSLSYVCTALLTGARTVILTSTKALMTQVSGDFTESGMIEIRGLNSYECLEGGPTGKFGDMKREGYRADRGLPMMCDEAPCQAGAFCARREGGCLYYDAYRKATMLTSKLIVTNYDYWMSINRYGDGLGKVDLLVLDEAHNAIEELSGFVGTELKAAETEAQLPGNGRVLDGGADQGDWMQWAGFWRVKVANALETIKQSIKESERTGIDRTGERLSYGALRRARELRRLQHKLDTIASMKGEWVIDYTEDNIGRSIIKFDPVWPGDYAESHLFLGVPKVVMVSATVKPEMAYKLGIKEGELDFKEYPSPIPKAHRPVIYVPTAHMNYKSAKEGMPEMVRRIDQIIDRRLDRKAIIHTVSYGRMNEIFRGSLHRDRMLTHDSMNTKEVIAQFKKSKQPLILVSPVLDTGYDFPYEEAEFQIICKVPFPMTTDKVVKARTKLDPGYRDLVTMIKLVQMAGRICRAEDDQGECVAPHTRVLTNDLRWVEAGSVSVGDTLMGFEEEGEFSFSPRRWRWSTVERALTRVMPRVRVILEDGELICTPNHPWLTFGRSSRQYRTLVWKRADELTSKDQLVRVVKPWATRNDWVTGWAAGFADGEGCLKLRAGTRNPNVCGVVLIQNAGPTTEFAKNVLGELGFGFNEQTKGKRSTHLSITGGHNEILRFLGQVRPGRLLSKFTNSPRNEVMRRVGLSKVQVVERLIDGPITSLQTSEKTYIAEGFGAHNTFILDSDFGWWYFGTKAKPGAGLRLCPWWFKESVRVDQYLMPPLPKLVRAA